MHKSAVLLLRNVGLLIVTRRDVSCCRATEGKGTTVSPFRNDFKIVKKMFHWQLTSFRARFDCYGSLLRDPSLGRVWRPAKVVPSNCHWRRYGVVFPSRSL